jgi:hypothetical protein
VTVFVTLVMFGASCTGAVTEKALPPAATSTGTNPATPSAHSVTDYSSFADALGGQGFSVRSAERAGFPSSLMDVPGKGVLIDGEPVLAFEFPTKKAFDEVRSTIRPRGDTIAGAIINWDPPRFYGAGRLLVLYFGDKRRAIDALERLLGPQFAGG